MDNAAKILISIPVLDPISSAQVVLAMSQPPGADQVVDALRAAVLGTAATHQAFLLSRSGPDTDGHLGLVRSGAGSDIIETQRQLAQSFRRQAKQLLAKACTHEVAARSDAALVAVHAISLIDIFGGGSGEHWSRNLILGKALIKLRGGPTAALRQASPASRPQTRLFLELIAAYDVFGAGFRLFISDASRI
jgi:hypothetical protein